MHYTYIKSHRSHSISCHDIKSHDITLIYKYSHYTSNVILLVSIDTVVHIKSTALKFYFKREIRVFENELTFNSPPGYTAIVLKYIFAC